LNQSRIEDRFVTLLAAILDPASHAVTLVNAGHPPPLLYRRSTRTVNDAISTEVGGFPLGVVDGFEYASCQISLAPGDSLLAFTDGVTEAMDIHDEQFETRGVCAALEGNEYSPRAIGDRVVEAVKQFSAGRSQHDDIALVGFGRTA
jgi:serine phosphatase RsbU (regulator of sigma subunit)